MKKIIIIALFIALILAMTPICLAQGEGEEPAAPETMTPQTYDQMTHPKLADFQKLDKPSSQQFAKLSQSDQIKYISGLRDADFSGKNANLNMVVAQEAFVDEKNGVKTINGAKEAFAAFLKKKDVNLKGAIDGNIKGFSRAGVLEGSNGKVNINDFKKGGDLERFEMSIVKGEIILNNKNKPDQQIKFTGEIQSDHFMNIVMNSGTIDGKAVVKGSEIDIDENGRIKGKFSSFGGITFAEPTSITVDKTATGSSIMTLNNAKIASIAPDTQMFVKGTATGGPDLVQSTGNGALFVKPGDTFTFNGIKIEDTPGAVPKPITLAKGEILRPGASNAKVSTLQKMLADQGYLTAGSYKDGTYDDATTKAVIALQQAANKNDPNAKLQEDGVLGPLTLAKLTPTSTKLGNIEVDIGQKSSGESLSDKITNLVTWARGSSAPDPTQGGTVRITDGIDAKGFAKVSYDAAGLKANGDAAGNGKGFIDLPTRGYYQIGDGSAPGPDQDNIKKIQQMLIDKGILAEKDPTTGQSSADGVFGPKTEAALRKWQGDNHLTKVDGLFGSESQSKYLGVATGGTTVIDPNGGEVIVTNTDGGPNVAFDKGATVVVNGKTLSTDGTEITKKAQANEVAQTKSEVPTTVDAHNEKGKSSTVEVDPKSPKAQTMRVRLGTGGTYDLEVGKPYLVTMAKSAFTDALAPTDDEVKALPPEYRDQVKNAGHAAVVYIDPNTKQLRATENTLAYSMVDAPFSDPKINYLSGRSQGSPGINYVYAVDSADSEKVLSTIKESQGKVSWWFFDVPPTPVTNYRTSCIGWCSDAYAGGGVSLAANADYESMKGMSVEDYNQFLVGNGVGAQKPVDKSQPTMDQIGPAIKNAVAPVEAPVGKYLLKGGVGALSSVEWATDKVGIGPSRFVATPPQVISGGLQKGILRQVKPVGK